MTGSVEEIIISTLKPKCLICLIHYQSSDLKVDAETLGISIPKRRCSLSPHGCSTLRPRNKKYAPERVAQRILLRSVCRVRQKRCARPPACGPPAVALDACGGPALVRPGRNGRRGLASDPSPRLVRTHPRRPSGKCQGAPRPAISAPTDDSIPRAQR